MAYESFHDFIRALEKAGELTRIALPVATELEITELADRQMKSPGGGKALLLEKPTINGVVSPFPVAINAMGSWKRMALSLGANSVEEVADELGSLMKARPPMSFREALKLLGTALDLRHMKPKPVKDGPCKEVIHKFDPPSARSEPWPAAPDIMARHSLATAEVSPSPGGEGRGQGGLSTLLNLPIQKCWPLDGGRFITLPCVVTKDPDTGERNVGVYRLQIYDERTLGMHWQLQKVGARHGRRHYETGARMPVAVFLGGDPVFTFAATAPLPDRLDEFLLAGYLRKKSVELVKCETNDLEVPANADFVIEGYVDPREPLRDEGPFGDHTGYYTLPEPYPVFHVTAITHRQEAVYPATIVGMPPMEDFYIGSASVKLFLPIFRMNEIEERFLCFGEFTWLKAENLFQFRRPLDSVGRVQLARPGAHAARLHGHNQPLSAVLFRLCANTDPQRDSIFTKGPADVLDHATSEIAIGTKLGIDATKKLSGEGFKRPWPPLIKMDGAVKAKVEKHFNL